jgi:hypothetical protein
VLRRLARQALHAVELAVGIHDHTGVPPHRHARLGMDAKASVSRRPVYFVRMKYAGWCQNDFNIQGYARRGAAVAFREVLEGAALVVLRSPWACGVIHAPCSDLTPIFIGMHRNAPLFPMKEGARPAGYAIPMVPMHLPPMAPRNLVEKIRAL